MEMMRCVRIPLDEFEDKFDKMIQELTKESDEHCMICLEHDCNEFVTKGYYADDIEGKNPIELDLDGKNLQTFAENIVGFRPTTMIPYKDYVYCIACQEENI